MSDEKNTDPRKAKNIVLFVVLLFLVVLFYAIAVMRVGRLVS